ncbi:MAG TPA: redoxin domain-containing protein, partial [Pyrinomonadaceae bacterium]|nr:redoxin domain-containing protein [Pyrinomonadaceae bacterium]
MKRTVLMLAVIAGVAIAFGVFSGSGRADGIQIGAAVENFSLPDLNGETKSLNELKGKNGAVLVWLSAQCPVVKGYNDRILEISEEFKAKGI